MMWWRSGHITNYGQGGCVRDMVSKMDEIRTNVQSFLFTDNPTPVMERMGVEEWWGTKNQSSIKSWRCWAFTVGKEIKCGGETENELVHATTRISSCLSDFREVSWMNSSSIAVSLLHLISFLTVWKGRWRKTWPHTPAHRLWRDREDRSGDST